MGKGAELFNRVEPHPPSQGVGSTSGGKWTAQLDAYEVMERLQKAGVAAGVVQDAAQLTNDPHLKARGFIAQTEHPEMGQLLHGGMPLKLSLTPGSVRCHAPAAGGAQRLCS